MLASPFDPAIAQTMIKASPSFPLAEDEEDWHNAEPGDASSNFGDCPDRNSRFAIAEVHTRATAAAHRLVAAIAAFR